MSAASESRRNHEAPGIIGFRGLSILAASPGPNRGNLVSINRRQVELRLAVVVRLLSLVFAACEVVCLENQVPHRVDLFEVEMKEQGSAVRVGDTLEQLGEFLIATGVEVVFGVDLSAYRSAIAFGERPGIRVLVALVQDFAGLVADVNGVIDTVATLSTCAESDA